MLEKVTGYTENEIQNMNIAEFFFEKEREKISEFINKTIDDSQSIIKADILTKDGRHITYEFTGSMLKGTDKKIIGITGMGRDIKV